MQIFVNFIEENVIQTKSELMINVNTKHETYA